MLLEEVLAMTSVFSWQNSLRLCPASFFIPRSNLLAARVIYIYIGVCACVFVCIYNEIFYLVNNKQNIKPD